jgi:uncharacterized LabA/DUF88 family protein
MKSFNKSSKEATYAFIDSQNLNLSIRAQGWMLDFKRFRVYLYDKYQIDKAFLFIGYILKNKNLYEYLKKSGYKIIFKPVVESKKHKVKTKGNVDAELVLHTMIEFPKYDRAIIVSGDGDFYCLVEYLMKKKKLERLLVPNYYKYSALLRKFSKKIDFMNGLKPKLSQKKRGINLRTKP